MNILVTASSTVTPANFAAAAGLGMVVFHKERANGTLRKVHFLRPDSRDREIAEYIEGMRDNDKTISWIARDQHMSEAAVRRALSDLTLTREFEEMDEEELHGLLLGAHDFEETVSTEERDITVMTDGTAIVSYAEEGDQS